MAFPAYTYPGYQSPYYPQPIPDQMLTMRQNQPPLAGNQPGVPPQSNGIIWVNNRQEADNYMVLPGSAVALWDANNPVIYLRQADNTGKPSTKIYDLVERTDNPQQKQEQPAIDLSNFVNRSDLSDFVRWDDLDDRIEQALSERFKKPSKSGNKKEDD